jgi:hypothetical protein
MRTIRVSTLWMLLVLPVSGAWAASSSAGSPCSERASRREDGGGANPLIQEQSFRKFSLRLHHPDLDRRTWVERTQASVAGVSAGDL